MAATDYANGYANGGAVNGANGGVGGAASMAQTLGMQWNPKHLEIETRTVEKTLEPLVMQVRR